MVAIQGNAGGLIDLPAEMQRELCDLEERADRLTYYDLLGVSAAADGAVIRRAFLERSKRFHPDAWYRKELGPFGPLLSKWFQRMSAAYQVLSDADSRAEYDNEHRTELSEVDRKAVQERELSRSEQERRLREGRERLLRTKGFARVGAARKLYEQALEHAANGARSQAIAALKGARELDPMRKEIAAKLVEIEREQAKARAVSALSLAKEREDRRKYGDAKTLYASAFQLDPTNFDAAMGAARCALEEQDLRSATSWGARAVELRPADAPARLFVAQIFIGAGMKARAKAELTALLDKNPDHKEAKALLKAL